MKILDNLTKLFESRFGDLFTKNTFKLFDFSRNTNYVLDTKDGEKLLINLNKATDEEKRAIKGILDNSIQDDEEIFLTEKGIEKTEQIKRNLPKQSDEDLLKYYKDKLVPDLYKALEMSLVVRNAFRCGEDILELKKDISRKFPEWGNNICNLTTSDYFDFYFKELYETMIKEENFNIMKYQEEVERIVISLPYMVFINRYKSLEEFMGVVAFKLDKLKRYGTNKLKLHAIGLDNVIKSLKIIEAYEKDEGIILEREINPNRTIATITFKF